METIPLDILCLLALKLDMSSLLALTACSNYLFRMQSREIMWEFAFRRKWPRMDFDSMHSKSWEQRYKQLHDFEVKIGLQYALKNGSISESRQYAMFVRSPAHAMVIPWTARCIIPFTPKHGDLLLDLDDENFGYRNDGVHICYNREKWIKRFNVTIEVSGPELCHRELCFRELCSELDDYGALPTDFYYPDFPLNYWVDLIAHNYIVNVRNDAINCLPGESFDLVVDFNGLQKNNFPSKEIWRLHKFDRPNTCVVQHHMELTFTDARQLCYVPMILRWVDGDGTGTVILNI